MERNERVERVEIAAPAPFEELCFIQALGLVQARPF
jgi:hypothetical protein